MAIKVINKFEIINRIKEKRIKNSENRDNTKENKKENN